MKKSNKKILYILAVFIVFAIIVFSVTLINYSSTPINYNDHKYEFVHINIFKDSSFLEVAEMLNRAGLVKNKFLFYSLAITKRSPLSFHTGLYKFNTFMTPSEIIDKLLLGENKKH
jgi:cell division protein YceG involved in septum cleavage